ncbi:preprotein translocase subunit SecA [Candidatus Peregrinibacteria bacterium]|nr:preprotein translocase subunit SecA [Candidatus Peregrinibacteria bacterium]
MDTLNRLIGDPSEKELWKIRPIADRVRAIQKSDAYAALTLADLPKKTEEFKERVRGGESLDSILPEAFALVVRACELMKGQKKTEGKMEFIWEMVPYDVQLIGGAVLHRGAIAEMKTGEGKTLVCTLPVYLNALTGKGVHVVTVNDYLAKRDAAWMGMLYEALGLTVGVIIHEKTTEERRKAYACDVTYGTNNEFGFDYLRDNMAVSLERQVQRGLHYAIVDEVDSILIDEARTPLIISQPAGESTEKYVLYSRLVKGLSENVHYNRDEKQRAAVLTDEGIKKMEELLGVENIYTEKGFEEVHHIEQALRAHAIYQRDVDYVSKDGEIIIVDEFTGRLMPGRRYSHGLHQAIEAKEGVEVQRESKTLATITFQNYFRLFEKLAGMTGTAKTEEEEFESIYKLRTFVIPTNQPVVRDDKPDAVYRTVAAKFKAVAAIAKAKHLKGQPVLIGTTSIEKSEVMSALLTQDNIPHSVLNAKQHEKEAEIVAQAGQSGTVTIATNMAGRGTDIKLGAGVTNAGGLCILGTERHESRRIDNQLRGRAGRQGDPGESRFFVSMEDDLMRLFGGDRLKSLMERLKVPDDVPLENTMVSRSIESAQKRVEGRNFDIRRHVVQYDDVMNRHREIIYKRRQKILVKLAEIEGNGEMGKSGIGEQPLHQDVLAALRREAEAIVEQHAQGDDSEAWNTQEMHETVATLHPELAKEFTAERFSGFHDRDGARSALTEAIVTWYERKCSTEDAGVVAQAERVVTLQSIDTHWMDHIDDMSHLREQVAFAGYAQRDPLIEYKDQGFRRFAQLLSTIDSMIIRTLLQADFTQFIPRVLLRESEEKLGNIRTNEGEISAELEQNLLRQGSGGQAGVGARASSEGNPAVMRTGKRSAISAPRHVEKVGRNDPCPCGSGKKYKKCHGTNAS